MNGSSSPTSSNRLPAWIFLIVTLIIPSAAGLTAFQTVIEHPLQAIGFFLLYEFLVILTSLVTGVWQQLQSAWVKSIVDWINSKTKGLFYLEYYRQSLIFAHRSFDIKGLKTQADRGLDLENVFVELTMARTPPHQTTSDPLHVSKVPKEKQLSIWHYLTSKEFKNENLVIIGTPGSGKTTLLQHVTLSLADQKKRRRIPKVTNSLPFFLFLRDYSDKIKDISLFSLADAVKLQVDKWAPPVPPGWVEHQLARGKCLILLDGLDEVADQETRRQMADWVQRQMVTFRNNRFIITSRPFGYKSNPLDSVTVLEVQPFTYDKIRLFIHNWYLATEIKSEGRNDQGVRIKANDGAEDLLSRLRSKPVLLNLAVNPLLLTMIATVHRFRAALPDKRVALYEEICEVSLGKRQEARGLRSELSPKQKQWVLQPLAYHMMQKGIREITLAEAESVIQEQLARVNPLMTPQEFLLMIENSSSLLIEREIGIYAFAHLTFQEYLAAMYVRENKLEKILVARIDESWWHETILLYCARADATPIINECLSRNPLSVDALKLAMDCREEAHDLQPDVRAQLEVIINQYAEDPNPERRHVVAKALLIRRLHQFVPLSEEKYADRSLINCTEYQLFLDEKKEQGYNLQPDLWTGDLFPSGTGQKPALGIRSSDALAFCIWLTEQESGSWRYRLPTSEELGQLEWEEGNMIENDKQESSGFWINEGKDFAWVRGRKPKTKIISQEQLDHFSSLDDNLIEMRYQQLNLNDTRHQSIREYIIIARRLAYARTLITELTQVLNSIRARVQTHEKALQDEYENARKKRRDLQTRLDNFRKSRNEVQTKLNSAKEHVRSLQSDLNATQARQVDIKNQLDNIRKDEHETHTQFNTARKRENSLQAKSKLTRQNEKIQMELTSARTRKLELDKKLDSVRENEHNLHNMLETAERRENNLKAELKNAQEQITNLQSQLKSIDRTGQENSLQTQLNDAKSHENNLQAQYNSFRAGALIFYNLYNRFLIFTPTYNKNDVLSTIIARNNVLNFDRVIFNINNNIYEETLSQIADLTSNFAKSLASELEAYRNNVNINIDAQVNTESKDIAHALSLANQLALIPFNEFIQKLAGAIKLYLNFLAENRPFGSKGRLLLRLIIRYFARELANHISYWSWKELLSLPTLPSKLQDTINENQNIVDIYLEAYVTFAILEERIGESPHFPAREGVLIIKEHGEEPKPDLQ